MTLRSHRTSTYMRRARSFTRINTANSHMLRTTTRHDTRLQMSRTIRRHILHPRPPQQPTTQQHPTMISYRLNYTFRSLSLTYHMDLLLQNIRSFLRSSKSPSRRNKPRYNRITRRRFQVQAINRFRPAGNTVRLHPTTRRVNRQRRRGHTHTKFNSRQLNHNRRHTRSRRRILINSRTTLKPTHNPQHMSSHHQILQ